MRRSRGNDDTANSTFFSARDLENTTIPADFSNQEVTFSPHSLAKKLEEVKSQITAKSLDDLELMDFDHENTEDVDEFLRKRDEIRTKVTGTDEDWEFDANGRTALNLDNAAIAGAKMLVDEKKMTRSMSRKLHDDCGINEDDVLYRGLKNEKSEKEAVMDVMSHRQSSVVESFVDFQKQLQFKMHVLEGVAATNPELAKSEASRRLTRKQQMEKDLMDRNDEEEKKKDRKKVNRKRFAENQANTTPDCSKQINPLDCQKIIENYALEVASEVRESHKRRCIAPVPFNINLLDSDEDEDI